MRRLVVVSLLLLFVAGACGGSSGARTTSLDDVAVTSAGAAEPTLDFRSPFASEETTVKVLTPGTGAAATEGATLLVQLLVVNGKDGEKYDSSYGGAPLAFTLNANLIPGLAKGLSGAQGGSRLLIAMAPDDAFGPQGGVEGTTIGADDTLLFVVDVQQVRFPLARATGTPVEAVAGLPAVALDATSGAPTVTIPATDPPAGQVSQLLIKGTGTTVAAGQSVLVQYTGLVWKSRATFDSSWDTGAAASFVIGAGKVIPGWDEGIVGQAVGSQLLLVIPPEKGYGATGNPDAGIAATDTLVFVVDILDAY
jgi:peptidylprolyl isomerase